MDESEKCNVPGCEKKQFCRGLCMTCYTKLKKGKEDVRKEIEQYLNPSSPGRKKIGSPKKSWTDTPKKTEPDMTPDAAKTPARKLKPCTEGLVPQTQPQSDTAPDGNEVFGAAVELLGQLGCETMFFADGILGINPLARKAVWVTNSGNVQSVKILVGPSDIRIL